LFVSLFFAEKMCYFCIMIYTLLIFLPAIVVMGLMIQFHIQKREWTALFTLTFIILVFIIHCITQMYVWYNGSDPENPFIKAKNVALGLIGPAMYIFLCSKSGTNWKTLSTVCLTALVAVNFLGGITLNIGKACPVPFPPDRHLHIMYECREIGSHNIFFLISLAQLIWIFVWAITFYQRMKKEKLHLNKQSETLAYFIIAVLLVNVFSIFIPASVWYNYLATPLSFFAITSALTTIIEVLISRGYAITLVLDENNEPAVGTQTINESKLERQIKEYVEGKKAYLNSELRIENVARELATNRTYISKAVKEMTGDNFNSYLNSLRIRDAKKMIEENPDTNLDVIAEKCGFKSGSSFTKVFKKETGLTPKEVRKGGKN